MCPTLIQNPIGAGLPPQAALDNTETLPMDVMQAIPTDSLPPSGSPGMSSAELRQQYQTSSEHPHGKKNDSEEESWTNVNSI